MNGPDGKPTTPDDDFEPLVLGRIRRDTATQQKWDDDPANKDEAEFWFEVPFRKTKLEAMKVQAQNVDAPDAVALAMRNAMLFYIGEAIDALPKDEEEVRSARPAKLKATIKRVHRRWTELDKRAAVLVPEGLSWVLAGGGGQPAGATENVRGRSGVGAKHVPRQDQEINLPKPDGEVTQWHADWSSEHPLAGDEEAWKAAKIKFPEKGVQRQVIRNIRKNPDGSHRPKGRKPGKSESEFR